MFSVDEAQTRLAPQTCLGSAGLDTASAQASATDAFDGLLLPRTPFPERVGFTRDARPIFRRLLRKTTEVKPQAGYEAASRAHCL